MRERLSATFPTVLSRKVEGEVNEVLLCSHGASDKSDAARFLQSLSQAAAGLQDALVSGVRSGTGSRPHIDIAELLKDLKVEQS